MKQGTFGAGANTYGGGMGSSSVSKPPKNFDDNDDSFFGASGGYAARTSNRAAAAPIGAGSIAGSFGGGSRQGSAHGSRKSQAEIEADEFDAMLDDIVQPTAPATAAPAKPAEHLPTGTFRKNSEDGWEDLNFGDNAGGLGSNRGFGAKSTGPQKFGSK